MQNIEIIESDGGIHCHDNDAVVVGDEKKNNSSGHSGSSVDENINDNNTSSCKNMMKVVEQNNLTKTDITTKLIDIDLQTYWSETPLHQAVWQNQQTASQYS